MDEINFSEIFRGFGISNLVLDIWWALTLKKHTFGVYTLFIGTGGLQ